MNWALQWTRCAACVLGCWLSSSCNAYDPALLDLASLSSHLSAGASSMPTGAGASALAGHDASSAGGASGASGVRAPTVADAGTGSALAAGSGSMAPAGSATTFTRCGDGQITGDEKCDLGIEAGKPGACPTACSALAPCSPRALNGTACQSECVLVEPSCKDADGCCPAACSVANDSDCSESCGDGIVQRDRGETCEPYSDQPCKYRDADCSDGDACTSDVLTGSAQHCNVACLNTPITQAISGDDCCPKGADANVDSDCVPRCGNGVREPGEACDGELGCDASCKQTLQPQQLACLEQFGSDECARCSCLNCINSYLACRASSDASANAHCTDIISCARANDCLGTSCYCRDIAWCAFTPGLCKSQIEAAAGTLNPLIILEQVSSTANPVGRAYAADLCRVSRCASECR